MNRTEVMRLALLGVALALALPATPQEDDASRVDPDGPYRSKMRILPPRATAPPAVDPQAALAAAGDDPYRRALVQRSLAYTAAGSGDPEQAIRYLQDALKTGALAPLAEAQMRTDLLRLWAAGNADGPLAEAYQRWRAEGHAFAAPEHLAAARALARLARHEAALAALREAQALQSQTADSWRELEVYLLAQLRRYKEAAAAQARRLQVATATRAEWATLVGLLGAADDLVGVTAATELAVERGAFDRPSDVEQLARLYLQTGLPDHAAYMLQQQLDAGALAPSPTAWRLLARAWLEAGDDAAAVAPLRLLAEHTDDGADHYRLGQLLHRLERHREATRSLARAVQRDPGPDLGRALLLLGEAHLALGDAGAARRAWTRAAGLGGSYRQAQALLARLAQDQQAAPVTTDDAPQPADAPLPASSEDTAPIQALERKTVPQQRFFYIAQTMTAAELPQRIGRMTRLLRTSVRRERLTVSGPAQFIALADPATPDGSFELQVGVPVRSRVAPRGEFRNRDTVPFSCVFRTFRGTAGELAKVWAGFAQTALAAGLTPTAETRTVLLDYSPADGRHLFELQLGIADP